ncbi:hypothetical protein F443_10491 [Phytophthora nicotianae P1569]|uniref:Uncharacterized protein n=1 Tax=Phytophthora nicotianae P1569 TaxID=1317065 RepID=V9F254_PHYNI|nr:hypothetical protein F443_10491 [Phytophthora nicotianae P1569]
MSAFACESSAQTAPLGEGGTHACPSQASRHGEQLVREVSRLFLVSVGIAIIFGARK